MDSSEYLLRWNNYQITLSQIFTGWWKSGSFTDCTLVVDRKQIVCHRFVLSACSTFFENLLVTHDAHPHPILILFDVSYDAVYALLEFMYKGEVHVCKELLPDVVKAARALNIKGISDSPEIAEFSNQFLSVPQQQFRIPTPTSSSSHIPMPIPYSAALALARNIGTLNDNLGARGGNTTNDSNQVSKAALSHPKKRRRVEETLPLSPPISSGDSLNSDHNRVSPPSQDTEIIKQEHDEETSDVELQIDESASVASTSSESHASHTSVVDAVNQDLLDRLESAKSLVSMASQRTSFHLAHEQNLSQISNNNSLLMNGNIAMKKIKPEIKNNIRKYTNEQLQVAVEAVLNNKMPPAKAIAHYNIPRRTFFRKLSNERKKRGIPSSRENAVESYSASPTSISPDLESAHPIIVPAQNMTIIKNIQDTAKQIATFKNFLNINNDEPSVHFANYFKSLAEQRQKENEGVINESRQSGDSITSSERPLGEKNGGFDK